MMYKARHDELLDVAIFRANEQITATLQAVEMWKYSGVETCSDLNFRRISIQDEEIDAWLAQTGAFAPLPGPAIDAVLEGSIRLLFCDRTDFRPPGFGMSRKSFLAVERTFNLPPQSLESLFHYDGIFSRTYKYTEAGSSKLESIGFAIKVPQKMPIANYLLASSYDITTKTTTAFIHGAFLHNVLPIMRASLWQAPLDYRSDRRHNDYTTLNMPIIPNEITQSSQIISRLQSTTSQWCNPLLLPTILLENFMSRSQLFAWDLDDQVIGLERQTGVVFAGRTVHRHERSIQPELIPREKVRTLTQDMHTLLTEIIFFERVAEWSSDCAAFLAKAAKELDEKLGVEQRVVAKFEREMMEVIEFLGTAAKGLNAMQRSSKQRVNSQINVLYSFIGQIDNSLNAKIAVSSARDSSAMKTLALITTVFLPGTYVATLFSMSIFSWSSSSSSSPDSSTEVVSPRFWIYWAVTLPLTALVMILWRVWWVWQQRIYELEDQAAGAATRALDDGMKAGTRSNILARGAELIKQGVFDDSLEANKQDRK